VQMGNVHLRRMGAGLLFLVLGVILTSILSFVFVGFISALEPSEQAQGLLILASAFGLLGATIYIVGWLIFYVSGFFKGGTGT